MRGRGSETGLSEIAQRRVVDNPVLISDAQARQRPGQFAPVKVVGKHGGTGMETVGFSQVSGAGVPPEVLPAQGNVVNQIEARPVQLPSPPTSILEAPREYEVNPIVENWNTVARYSDNDVVEVQPMPEMDVPESILTRILGDGRILDRLTGLAVGGSQQAMNLLGRAYMFQFANMMGDRMGTEVFTTALENLVQIVIPGVTTTALVSYNKHIRRLFDQAQFDLQQLQISGIQHIGDGLRHMIVYAATPTIQHTIDSVAEGVGSGAVQNAFRSLLALFMFTLQMSINPATRAALLGRGRDGRSHRLASAVPRVIHNVPRM